MPEEASYSKSPLAENNQQPQEFVFQGTQAPNAAPRIGRVGRKVTRKAGFRAFSNGDAPAAAPAHSGTSSGHAGSPASPTASVPKTSTFDASGAARQASASPVSSAAQPSFVFGASTQLDQNDSTAHVNGQPIGAFAPKHVRKSPSSRRTRTSPKRPFGGKGAIPSAPSESDTAAASPAVPLFTSMPTNTPPTNTPTSTAAPSSASFWTPSGSQAAEDPRSPAVDPTNLFGAANSAGNKGASSSTQEGLAQRFAASVNLGSEASSSAPQGTPSAAGFVFTGAAGKASRSPNRRVLRKSPFKRGSPAPQQPNFSPPTVNMTTPGGPSQGPSATPTTGFTCAGTPMDYSPMDTSPFAPSVMPSPAPFQFAAQPQPSTRAQGFVIGQPQQQQPASAPFMFGAADSSAAQEQRKQSPAQVHRRTSRRRAGKHATDQATRPQQDGRSAEELASSLHAQLHMEEPLPSNMTQRFNKQCSIDPSFTAAAQQQAEPISASGSGTPRRAVQRAARKHVSPEAAFNLGIQPDYVPPTNITAEEASAAEAARRRTAATARAENLHLEGIRWYKEKQYDKAVVSFMQGLGALDGLPDVGARKLQLLTNVAACHIMVHQPEKAVEFSLQALEFEPSNSRALSRCAKGYLMSGRVSQAISMLERMESNCPRREELQEELDRALEAYRSSAAAIRARGAAEDAVQSALKQLEMLLESHILVGPQTTALRGDAFIRLAKYSKLEQLASSIPRRWPASQHCRWWLRLQGAYHKGVLEQAITYAEQGIQALQEANAAAANWHDHEVYGELVLPSVEQLQGAIAAWRDLLEVKTKGNRAFSQKKYADALQHYHTGLTANNGDFLPPTFAAVLYSNRAAAQQGLGDFAQALADCGRAKACDPSYIKAQLRMSSLLSDVGRFQCALDVITSMQSSLQGVSAEDQNTIRTRRSELDRSVREKQPADHYKLFGLKRECSGDEIRKAYRKLALQLHPDKALRNFGNHKAVGCIGLGVEPLVCLGVEDRVRAEADWLFKRLGEANEVLSDGTKRRQLDLALSRRRTPMHRGYSYYHQYEPDAYWADIHSFYRRTPTRGAAPRAGPHRASQSSYYPGHTYGSDNSDQDFDDYF